MVWGGGRSPRHEGLYQGVASLGGLGSTANWRVSDKFVGGGGSKYSTETRTGGKLIFVFANRLTMELCARAIQLQTPGVQLEFQGS